MLDVTLDVFHHHNGIIDHDTDGKHEAEKAECIDGETKHIHYRKRTDDGDRYGNQRNDRGTPCLQKQDNHDHDENDGFKQCVNHGLNRGFHELRGVIDDIEIDAFRH